MKNKHGFSIIEILIVVVIMTIFSVLPFLYLSNSKNSVLLKGTVEILEDNISLIQSGILSEKMQSVSMFFSLSHPRLYLQKETPNFIESIQELLPANVQISGITDISSSDVSGSVTLDWSDPEDGSTAISLQITNAQTVLQEDDINRSVETYSYAPINSNAHILFRFLHPVQNIIGTKMHLLFFSEHNLDALSQNTLELENIEVQDFFGNWNAVSDVEVQLTLPHARQKYYYNNQEYQSARITLGKGGETIIYNF